MASFTEIYETAPQGFVPKVEASGCYLKCQNKTLWLRRSPSKMEPGTWGVPGGKLEPNETPLQAGLRELYEETSIVLKSSELRYVTKLYIRKNYLVYVYHMFAATLKEQPPVRLSAENDDYKWVTVSELVALPLIEGTWEILDLLKSKMVL